MKTIRLIDHIQEAWQIVFSVLLFLVFPAFGVFEVLGAGNPFSLKVGVGLFTIVFTPQLLLHSRYALLNHKLGVRLRNRKKEIELMIDDVKCLIKDEDIKTIQFVFNGALGYRNTLPWFPWQTYSYCVVELKDSERLLLTNLLVDDVGWLMNSEKATIRTIPYCWPPYVDNACLIKNYRMKD